MYALAAMQRAIAESKDKGGKAGGSAGSGGLFADDADAEAAVGVGRSKEEEDWMLVAADAGLAKEGPGLVERFLIAPPSEEEELSGAESASAGHAAVASQRSDGSHYATVQSERYAIACTEPEPLACRVALTCHRPPNRSH